MSNFNKCPPLLSKSKSYKDWLKLIEIWRTFSTLEPEKQGPAIVLSLEGEAQEAILELDTATLVKKDGVDKIIARLNKIYKKDELCEKYNALESFETYKRPSNTSIRDFLTEFEKRYNKTKSYGTIMSDDLLAYRLIKSANLPSSQEQLIRATVTDLKFDQVRSKITKIFSDQSEVPSSDMENLNIKSEPIYYSQEEQQDLSAQFQEEEYYTPDTTHQQSDEDLDTFYSSRHYQRGGQRTRFRATPSYPRNNSY